jgi:hypothetical protein
MAVSSCSTNAGRIGCIKRFRLARRGLRLRLVGTPIERMLLSHLDRTSSPFVCSVLFRLCPNLPRAAVKTVRLCDLALLAHGYEGLSAPRMPGLRGCTLVRDTGAETPCSNVQIVPRTVSCPAPAARRLPPRATSTHPTPTPGRVVSISACDAPATCATIARTLRELSRLSVICV